MVVKEPVAATTRNLPEISNQLINFIGVRLAETTVADWKKMTEEARKPFKAKARRILTAERRFFSEDNS